MGGGLPAGTILPFAGNTPPPGYLLCDGALVNETQYPELFAAIGTAWCSGAGAGDFRVPDLRGRFMRGADDGANRDEIGVRTASNVGGSAIGVGSLQGDATRRPNNSFVTNVAGEHTHSAPTELGASGGGTFEIGFPGGAPSPT